MNGEGKHRRLKDKLQENAPHRAFTVRIVRGVFAFLRNAACDHIIRDQGCRQDLCAKVFADPG